MTTSSDPTGWEEAPCTPAARCAACELGVPTVPGGLCHQVGMTLHVVVPTRDGFFCGTVPLNPAADHGQYDAVVPKLIAWARRTGRRVHHTWLPWCQQ